jgi:hypothetical protein
MTTDRHRLEQPNDWLAGRLDRRVESMSAFAAVAEEGDAQTPALIVGADS